MRAAIFVFRSFVQCFKEITYAFQSDITTAESNSQQYSNVWNAASLLTSLESILAFDDIVHDG